MFTHAFLVKNAGERIRTFAGTKPTALEAAPFDHSGTPAGYLELYSFICIKI